MTPLPSRLEAERERVRVEEAEKTEVAVSAAVAEARQQWRTAQKESVEVMTSQSLS